MQLILSLPHELSKYLSTTILQSSGHFLIYTYVYFYFLFTFSVRLLASERQRPGPHFSLTSEVTTCTMLCVCACVHLSGESTLSFNHILQGVHDLENIYKIHERVFLGTAGYCVFTAVQKTASFKSQLHLILMLVVHQGCALMES